MAFVSVSLQDVVIDDFNHIDLDVEWSIEKFENIQENWEEVTFNELNFSDVTSQTQTEFVVQNDENMKPSLKFCDRQTRNTLKKEKQMKNRKTKRNELRKIEIKIEPGQNAFHMAHKLPTAPNYQYCSEAASKVTNK